MTVDHIGIAVRSLARAIPHLERVLGYRQTTEISENTDQLVRVVFMEKADSVSIKLIEPTSPESPAMASLKKGRTIDHLCFKCDDLNQEISRMQKLGSRVLVKPQPGAAFDGENIAFMFAGLGLNIGLIDTEKRTGRLAAE